MRTSIVFGYTMYENSDHHKFSIQGLQADYKTISSKPTGNHLCVM